MSRLERFHQPLSGLIGTVLVAALAVLGLKAAGGAYSDDYTLYVNVDRAGFGLDDQSTVKVRGITVGSVDGIQLRDDQTVRVTMKIRKETRIPTTASASVEPLSVFGPKFINLDLGAGEGAGPFMAEGDEIDDTMEPSEMVETLEKVADIIDAVDEEELSSILTELGRGFDGLGSTFGEMLDNTGIVADRALANRAIIDRLLTDARTMSELFADRGDDFAEVLDQASGVIEIISEREDPLAELLIAGSELSQQFGAVLRAGGDDLAAIVNALDPLTQVLYTQLSEVPGFLQFAEDIFVFLADDLITWDLGDGRLGGVGQLTIALDPCAILALGC